MNEHRVTGSVITREKRNLTVVTLTCSCGKQVTQKGKNLALIEIKLRRAYNRHKAGR